MQMPSASKVVSLIFSDVLENEIKFVASGPTVKDTTTIDDAVKVLATMAGMLQ